jgi:hypothetical protein
MPLARAAAGHHFASRFAMRSSIAFFCCALDIVSRPFVVSFLLDISGSGGPLACDEEQPHSASATVVTAAAATIVLRNPKDATAEFIQGFDLDAAAQYTPILQSAARCVLIPIV